MDVQAMFNAASAAARLTRLEYHLTLGGAIEQAATIDAGLQISFSDTGNAPLSLHSYRGYYDDLAFDETGEPRTVGDFLSLCREAMGKTFEGYKGGDFIMNVATPLWASSYGDNSGRAVTDLFVVGGKAVLAIRQV